jgi:hypothetical protein
MYYSPFVNRATGPDSVRLSYTAQDQPLALSLRYANMS